MDSLQKFKEFIKDKEFLIDKVNNKETTWQNLYEIYDLYGENASIFKEPIKETVNEEVKKEENKENKSEGNSDNRLNSLLKAFEGVDVNKINENLEGVRKILAVLSEFTKKDEGRSKRTYERPNNKFDD